jgi:hypothetical protein
VNPNIKNWYLSEQFFGGMHGSGDLQKPSVYGKSICEAQGGNLQHTKRGSSPSASGYGRAAEPWTYPSLRENFGSFVCFKNGRADWNGTLSMVEGSIPGLSADFYRKFWTWWNSQSVR